MPHAVIVEDDRDLLAALASVLASEGWTADARTSTLGLASHLVYNPPDLVITDIQLTGVDSGWTLIELLRRDLLSLHTVPIIVITGKRAQLNPRRQWLSAMHIPVLEKPFDMEALLTLVREVAV